MRERSWPPPGAWRFRHTRRRASRAFHHQHGIIEFISIIHAMYTTSRIRLASSADRSARGGRESVCSTHRPARVDYIYMERLRHIQLALSIGQLHQCPPRHSLRHARIISSAKPCPARKREYIQYLLCRCLLQLSHSLRRSLTLIGAQRREVCGLHIAFVMARDLRCCAARLRRVVAWPGRPQCPPRPMFTPPVQLCTRPRNPSPDQLRCSFACESALAARLMPLIICAAARCGKREATRHL